MIWLCHHHGPALSYASLSLSRLLQCLILDLDILNTINLGCSSLS